MLEVDRRQMLRAMVSTAALGAGLAGCAASQAVSPEPAAAPKIDGVIENLEVISTGHNWSEGPVWVGGEDGQLLFSDVPGNVIHSWRAGVNSEFMRPSGYAETPVPDTLREAGSNGLAVGRGGLLMADSGSRVIAVVDLTTKRKTVIADRFEGRRLNSPNDLVLARNGDIYFTDPPYGLAGVLDSPLRELTFTGVFRITPDNQVRLITDALMPNGIALSPDERTLYVTDRAGWIAIDLDASGAAAGAPRVLVSRDLVGGGGDGMKADVHGNLWCSGPGGVHVFSPTGARLGHARIEGRVSNCAFGPAGYLYVTNDDRVVRGRITEGFAARARESAG